MWRKTPAAEVQRSTDEQRDMAVMQSASVSASGSRKLGWIKTVAGQEKTRFRGIGRVGFAFTFATAAYNLVRLPKLLAAVG
jgi:hypothetical protein